MKTLYIVYEGDAWLSFKSLDTIAVCTTPAMAVKLCETRAKQIGEPLTAEDKWNLENLLQTQCSRETNYHITPITTNTLF